MLEKQCTKCLELKPSIEFRKDTRTKDRLNHNCKACKQQYEKLHYQKNKDRYLQINRKWKNKNKEKVKRNAQRYEEENRERIKEVRDNRRSGERFKLQSKAHASLEYAINTGKIERPDNCSNCGSNKTQIQGHHTDYNNPLDVIWLCQSCHLIIHGKERRSSND